VFTDHRWCFSLYCLRQICGSPVQRETGDYCRLGEWNPEYTPEGVGGDVAEGFIARLAKEAYERASLGPKDVKVCQVHDAFSPGEVFAAEELDFCPAGEGGQYVWDGKTDINGEHPINTDGGLESRGHPMGATELPRL